MIARAFPVTRVLVCLLLAALAWGTWAEIRVARAKTSIAQAEQALQAEKRDRAEKFAQAVEKARAEDAATIASQAKALKVNHDQIQALRADVGRLRSVTGGLRDDLARIRADAAAAASDPSASAASKAAATAGAVLAELLDRCSERRAELARYADEARTAGALCVATYDALPIGPPSP